MPRAKLWKRLEEMGFSPEYRSAVISLCEKVVANMKCNSEWSMDVNVILGLSKGAPFSRPLWYLHR